MERRQALAASAALTLACLFCVSEVPSWPSNHISQIPVTILTTAAVTVAGKKESSFQWQMAEQAYDKQELKMFAIPTVAWDQEVTKESLQAQILEQRRASGSGRARNMDVDMSEAKVLMAQAAACFAAEFSPAAANVTDLHNASKSVDCSAYNAAAKDHV